ncbi:MAG: DUF3429 domain-containing protein [Alphaproteobacteria bacterium]|nr:DUF3429 domain-containing protein [Alphaproteobacteria bacterium]MDX5370661.1 DUF3429 domain-containing protein [Alphaproteobacteria bacterium]MDX5465098.1 DUF3429 domain-containing protein [Alphaproteobacteria bacterium]
MSRTAETAEIPRAAAWLGGLGLLPFAFGAGAALLGDPVWRTVGGHVLLGYGAVILAFMGGAQWGASMHHEPGIARRLTLSVVPALAAFGALLLGPQGLWVLIAGFWGVLVVDMGLARDGLAPAWYPRLRIVLTATVSLLLLAGAAAPFL